MGRLILKGVLLALAVVVTCAAILVVMPRPHNTFFLGAADKWRAAEQAPSPKLLVVGGSNTAFGIDSEALGEALDLPVVNLGLHAGLGLEYMLREAEGFVEGGDLVVVSPEYEQFFGRQLWGRQQLLELAWLHPASLRYMTAPRQLLGIVRGFPTVFQNRLRSLWLDVRSPNREVSHDIYNRDAFNAHGDVVAHLDAERDRPVEEMPLLRDTTAAFNQDAVRALAEFHTSVRERGARAFIVLPTIPEPLYRLREAEVTRVYEALREGARAPVLGAPSLQTGGAEDFFDTAYHLSRRGRAAQTERLIVLLRPRLDRPGEVAGRPGG